MSDPTQMFWNPGGGHQGADRQCVLAVCLLTLPPQGLVLLGLLMWWFAGGRLLHNEGGRWERGLREELRGVPVQL